MSMPKFVAYVIGGINLLISVMFPSVSLYFINFPFFILFYLYGVVPKDTFSSILGYFSFYIISFIGALHYAGLGYLIAKVIEKDLEYLDKYGGQWEDDKKEENSKKG